MKVPHYQPSSLVLNLQRRILVALLVAGLAMVFGLLSYPYARRYYYLNQLEYPGPAQRLRALNIVMQMATRDPLVRDRAEETTVELFTAEDQDIRNAAVDIAAWAVKNVPTFEKRLEGRLTAVDEACFAGIADALRKAGKWNEDERSLPERCRRATLRCKADLARDRAAAIHALGNMGPQCADYVDHVIAENLQHDSSQVRRAAVEAASICLPFEAAELLESMLSDPDPEVAEEAALRLQLLSSPSPKEQPSMDLRPAEFEEIMQSDDYYVKLQAVEDFAGHAADETGGIQQRRDVLRKTLEQALAANNGGIAGQALLALASVSDSAYLPVMLDVAAGFTDQPMLRFFAARAAAQLDPEVGGHALVNLLAIQEDPVRDLAIVALGDLRHPAIVDRLASALYATELEVRGAAALALAFMNAGDLKVGEHTLTELLELRTTLLKDNIHAETEWKPRGYYLCARLVLGDPSVREELEIFLINEHFPRTAIYTTLLHSGETAPLDIILLSDTYAPKDRMQFLRELRFATIIARYIPDAPVLSWSAPPSERRGQLEKLAAWWTIYRWRLQFDPQRHVYVSK